MPGPGRPKGLPKTGGRKKGSSNKLSARAKAAVYDARAMMDAQGFDPIQAMMRVAQKAEAEGDGPLAMSGYKEIAKYYAPQLKAIEITGAGGQALTLQVVTGVPQ
jgi:hypothetical protein